ncbi:circadian clock protein KaiA [Leptolyngbya sp. PL-A3]|uniref:circadian clock protein KaiA n=1 Tax=Leptolyngbya sp. FACHB-8 TaxID=2692814 RepID=UPI0018EF5337|nr:circadian clock protein KaiA [Leptolyngbya sp. FACHB-8]
MLQESTADSRLNPSSASKSSKPRYNLTYFSQPSEFLRYIEQEKRSLDCLLIEASDIEASDKLPLLFKKLQQLTILLPTVILETAPPCVGEKEHDPLLNLENKPYHNAVLRVAKTDVQHVDRYVEEAIAKFLRLSTNDPPVHDTPADAVANLTIISSLSQQQQRLAEKLKERLGYLGVYYKRNPANFLRHMTPLERQELLQRLREDYRKIILEYFSSKPGQGDRINQAIDIFVNLAFFSDVSVSQIVEIHIELMDEFSKQLKLEGRSDDILQDYRLTLIDVIAHLCEMYRRSIPREA